MSAAAVVLPMVWAYACPQVAEKKGPQRVDGGPALHSAAVGLRQLAIVGASPAKQEVCGPSVLKSQAVLTGQVAFYRKYTEGLLRRYVKMSLEAGKTPSLLGQDMFRGKVTSYKVTSFEDVVIFVHDVGQCVAKLDKEEQHLIRRIAMQEYTQGETAGIMGLSVRTVHRKYTEAIDRLTGILLDRGLLEPSVACQEDEEDDEPVS